MWWLNIVILISLLFQRRNSQDMNNYRPPYRNDRWMLDDDLNNTDQSQAVLSFSISEKGNIIFTSIWSQKHGLSKP